MLRTAFDPGLKLPNDKLRRMDKFIDVRFIIKAYNFKRHCGYSSNVCVTPHGWSAKHKGIIQNQKQQQQQK